jgi:3,4-dihydroxy 2-butanone 4-phosphate synthase / GTP cyclohydrolase II
LSRFHLPFISVEEGLERIRDGQVLIVVDDERRENEGDFVCAAERVTPETINYMAGKGRGLICAPTTPERLTNLGIPMMVTDNTARLGTAFAVMVDALEGTTTGISASDRAVTLRKLADPAAVPGDFGQPGHIPPLRAERGGVLRRAGHTEAVVDLMVLAGMQPVGVLCEIMSPDGTMARLPELMELARQDGLGIVTIESLIAHRRRNEKLVERLVDVDLPTRHGSFRLYVYGTRIDNDHHLALVKGDVNTEEPVVVRVHSSCLTGDVLGSLRCDCGDQLRHAQETIEQAGRGVLLYMNQEGRGIGLYNKILAYKLQQEKHLDTVEANHALGFEADLRDYGIGAQILADLGVRKMCLLTNNPRKLIGLEGYGLEIVERLPVHVGQSEHNLIYLRTKKEKLGHEL